MKAIRSAPVRDTPRVDVVTYLTIWLVLLAGINARQVVGVFGEIGSPALLITIPALLFWAAGWIVPQVGLDRRPHPMRPALLLYVWIMMASYVVAMSRPLTELEASGAGRALVTSLALVGIALLVADGINTLSRLETLLRRLVTAIAFVSLLGIAQFFSGQALQLDIPGLVWNSEAFLAGRSAFTRPGATTLHPIEFSVVTAAALPLAIHFALMSSDRTARRNFAVASAIIALAVPLSISRSGLLALAVGLLTLSFAWNWRRRFSAAITFVIAVPVLWMAIPGLVGTLISLFEGTDYDPSIQARIDRRPRIMSLIRQRPWLGLGNGTWSVDDYFLIDNEIYVTTLETGITGALVVAGIFATGVFVAIAVKYLPGADASTGHLGHAIGASIASIAISFATFDAFHYRILTGMLFVLLGAAGALWRLRSDLVPQKIDSKSGFTDETILPAKPGAG